jgi:hypothetical protein
MPVAQGKSRHIRNLRAGRLKSVFFLGTHHAEEAVVNTSIWWSSTPLHCI